MLEILRIYFEIVIEKNGNLFGSLELFSSVGATSSLNLFSFLNLFFILLVLFIISLFYSLSNWPFIPLLTKFLHNLQVFWGQYEFAIFDFTFTLFAMFFIFFIGTYLSFFYLLFVSCFYNIRLYCNTNIIYCCLEFALLVNLFVLINYLLEIKYFRLIIKQFYFVWSNCNLLLLYLFLNFIFIYFLFLLGVVVILRILFAVLFLKISFICLFYVVRFKWSIVEIIDFVIVFCINRVIFTICSFSLLSFVWFGTQFSALYLDFNPRQFTVWFRDLYLISCDIVRSKPGSFSFFLHNAKALKVQYDPEVFYWLRDPRVIALFKNPENSEYLNKFLLNMSAKNGLFVDFYKPGDINTFFNENIHVGVKELEPGCLTVFVYTSLEDQYAKGKKYAVPDAFAFVFNLSTNKLVSKFPVELKTVRNAISFFELVDRFRVIKNNDGSYTYNGRSLSVNFDGTINVVGETRLRMITDQPVNHPLIADQAFSPLVPVAMHINDLNSMSLEEVCGVLGSRYHGLKKLELSSKELVNRELFELDEQEKGKPGNKLSTRKLIFPKHYGVVGFESLANTTNQAKQPLVKK